MKKISLFALLLTLGLAGVAQKGGTKSTGDEAELPASKVDFDAYDSLASEVKEYRKDRLINLAKFLSWSKEANTVILDTRSTEMYNRKHVKGAIHLDFSDFSQANLARLIRSNATRILIYCNNNFVDDQIRFVTKSYTPPPALSSPLISKAKSITLALNIPTFINLYGYGYKNVYELADLVSVLHPSIEFEGTDVFKPAIIPAVKPVSR